MLPEKKNWKGVQNPRGRGSGSEYKNLSLKKELQQHTNAYLLKSRPSLYSFVSSNWYRHPHSPRRLFLKILSLSYLLILLIHSRHNLTIVNGDKGKVPMKNVFNHFNMM